MSYIFGVDTLSSMYHTCKLQKTCNGCEYENICLPLMKSNSNFCNVFSKEFQKNNYEKLYIQSLQELD